MIADYLYHHVHYFTMISLYLFHYSRFSMAVPSSSSPSPLQDPHSLHLSLLQYPYFPFNIPFLIVFSLSSFSFFFHLSLMQYPYFPFNILVVFSLSSFFFLNLMRFLLLLSFLGPSWSLRNCLLSNPLLSLPALLFIIFSFFLSFVFSPGIHVGSGLSPNVNRGALRSLCWSVFHFSASGSLARRGFTKSQV